jgi:hypothetical protein
MPIEVSPATGMVYVSDPLAALVLDQASLLSRMAFPVPQQLEPAGLLQVSVKGVCATTSGVLMESVTPIGVWPDACVLNDVPSMLTVRPPV